MSDGGSKYNQIILCLIYFICKDIRPFNVVQGEGFKRLIKELAPTFSIPSSSFLKKKLTEKYEVSVQEFKEKLENIQHVCVMADVWTETMNEKSFLGTTITFLEGTKCITRNLGVSELKSNHTKDYLASVLKEKLYDFCIGLEKIRCIVTDNGANLIAAVKLLVGEKKHLPCFAHTINLVVESALSSDPVKLIIGKVRDVVKYIKNSVVNSDKLRKIQVDKGVPEGNVKKVILDVKTRWNSVYYMLERFIDIMKLCSEILIDDRNSPQMPSAQEIEVIKQIINLLRPFEYVTRELSGELYITVSKVIPMINCIHSQIESYNSNLTITNSIKESILSQLCKRFGNTEFNSHLALATLLDPRFKNIHFRDPLACCNAIKKLRDLIKADSGSGTGSDSSGEDSRQAPDPSYDFWKPHKDLVHGKKRKKNNPEDEVSVYLGNSVSVLKSDPLEQWEDMKYVFPSLYKQAREFLVTTASSVPCERLFSKAGETISQRRNKLSGSNLEKLLFLGSLKESEFFS